MSEMPREPRIVDPELSAELLNVLTRFHRDVLVPDMERIFDERIAPFRNEVMTNFDAVYARFDRLEAEYASLKAAVRRLEER